MHFLLRYYGSTINTTKNSQKSQKSQYILFLEKDGKILVIDVDNSHTLFKPSLHDIQKFKNITDYSFEDICYVCHAVILWIFNETDNIIKESEDLKKQTDIITFLANNFEVKLKAAYNNPSSLFLVIYNDPNPENKIANFIYLKFIKMFMSLGCMEVIPICLKFIVQKSLVTEML